MMVCFMALLGAVGCSDGGTYTTLQLQAEPQDAVHVVFVPDEWQDATCKEWACRIYRQDPTRQTSELEYRLVSASTSYRFAADASQRYYDNFKAALAHDEWVKTGTKVKIHLRPNPNREVRARMEEVVTSLGGVIIK
jgi:hypothetical protein